METTPLASVLTSPVLTFDPQQPGVQMDLEILCRTRLLIQAASGGGKSWLMRSLLEGSFGQVQHLVLDPEGEFTSLREQFDYVIAGPDGDVPAHPETAAALCDRLMETGASAVLDLAELSLEQRREFVNHFLRALVAQPQSRWRSMLVVLDEASMFCPKGQTVESSQAVVDLCALGRKRGYGAVLATQRLSKLHNDAAAECQNKMFGFTNLGVDVERVGGELGYNREQREALKLLEPGEFFAYGPAISRLPVRVRSGPIRTSTPRTRGVGHYTPPPAGESIRAILAQLHVPDPAAEAPGASATAELREALARAEARLAELEGIPPPTLKPCLAAALTQTDRFMLQALFTVFHEAAREAQHLAARLGLTLEAFAESPKVVVVREDDAGDWQLAERQATEIWEKGLNPFTGEVWPHNTTAGTDLQPFHAWHRYCPQCDSPLKSAGQPISHELVTCPTCGQEEPAGAWRLYPAAFMPAVKPEAEPGAEPEADPPGRARPGPEPEALRDASAGLNQPRLTILQAIARWNSVGVMEPTRENVARFAYVGTKSSGYRANLSWLRHAGYLELPNGDTVRLTPAGKAAAPRVVAVQNNQDFLDVWAPYLSSPQLLLLLKLRDAGGGPLSRERLARDAGTSPSSSGFRANLSMLATYGLVEYRLRSHVALTPLGESYL